MKQRIDNSAPELLIRIRVINSEAAPARINNSGVRLLKEDPNRIFGSGARGGVRRLARGGAWHGA